MIALAANDAAERGTMWADWATTPVPDEREVWTREGPAIAARSEDLERNNPVACALVGYLLDSVLGTDGLSFRSSYQADANAELTDAEKLTRRQINRWVSRCFAGQRWDASGRATTRDLLAQVLWCLLVDGNGLAVRVSKPGRPGDPLTAWCARVVHPCRIGNRGHGADDATHCQGWTLDRDGDPVAVTIRTSRGYLNRQPDQFTTVPIFGPDGLRNVCHLAGGMHPERLMGYGFLRPIAQVLKIEDNVRKTYLVAKQIQASYPLIIETDDPQTIAHAKSRQCFLGDGVSTYKLVPNKIYFAKRGTVHNFPEVKFNGADMADFSDHLIGIACSAVGLPISVAMKRLGKASLAAARAELADAWRTTLLYRQRLIDYVLKPWVSWAIWEGQLRGEFDVQTDDRDALFAGTFKGMHMPSPDRYKDMQAAAELRRLGASRTTALATVGVEFEDETHREENDRQVEAAVLGDDGLPDPREPAAAPAASEPDDDETGGDDDQVGAGDEDQEGPDDAG